MPRADVNGISIDYSIQGKGEPLVMIMGVGGGKNAWYAQTRFFRNFFRTVAFDNRGIGKSGKPEGQYSIRTMSEDTVSLMDHLGIHRAHIMGVSMGGMIAQEIAINHPGRVNKLVLGCTFAKAEESPEGSRDLKVARQEYIASPESRSAQRKMMSTLLDLSFNSRSRRILFMSFAKIALMFSNSNGTVEQMKAVWGHDTVERLGKITAPTLVITGTADRVIDPKSSEILSNLIPGSRLVRIEGGGHTFFMEMHDEFNREVMNFLKE